MSLVKEPKGIDLMVKSTDWTEKELAEFRKQMAKEKGKRKKESDKEKVSK